MQRVIEFKKKNFWSSQIDMNALNDKVSTLNKDGWVIKSITPNSTFIGIITSYTLLIELIE